MQEIKQERTRRLDVRDREEGLRKSVERKAYWELWAIGTLYLAVVANAVSNVW